MLDGLKIEDLSAAGSRDLLHRVRTKLKQYPHCHEVEETAREQDEHTLPGPLGIQTRLTYRGWKMSVDELEIARETGDLTPAVFELFAMACRS